MKANTILKCMLLAFASGIVFGVNSPDFFDVNASFEPNKYWAIFALITFVFSFFLLIKGKK